MSRNIITAIVASLVFTIVYSQHPGGNYQSGFIKEYNSFFLSNSNTDVFIEFCTPAMFRVRSSWTRKFEADEPWMVVKYKWDAVTVTSVDKKDHFLLSTSDLQLKVFKAPFRIEVYNKKGELLSADKVNAKNADTVSSTKRLAPDEHFFGFGERMDFTDQRSKKLSLNVGRGKGLPHAVGAYNVLEANYSPIPFFMSTKGYGIFFHNAYPTQWDMGASNSDEYKFSAAGGELDYYFIYGPKLPDVLEQYTSLTGRSPLVSLFALGLHVGTYSGGTWSYEHLSSDLYVLELARKLRALGIPVDLLWLDSTWRIFGKVGGKGATSFEWRETFKNPSTMFDSLYKMNFKMVGLHLRPRFDNGNKIKLLDTAQQLKYTYPENNSPGEFVNFFDSSAVNWWWNHGVMRVASLGAKFLKTDEGSAFGGLANESDKTGPTGKEISKLHNIFPLAYAKAPFEKFQSYNNMRGLNHTREGYAGIQRYPFIFAGDWPSEWQYFPAVIKAGLNIGMSGVGYWGHCMGGFEHNADPELYIRWCQFGMFSPVAMVFGMDHPGYKEPWNYGEDGLRNFKKYDSLRYALLPYLYNTAWQQYKTGLPLMRALPLHYQDDENVFDIADQYMLGDALMVCPVTTKGAQTRTVYLPEGEWFDWWTGKKYNGKKYVHVVTPLDTMPLFAKAGSIIQHQPSMRYVGEKELTHISLDIFPGNGKATLYEDDGTSLAYQQNQCRITAVTQTSTASSIDLEIAAAAGSFKSTAKPYILSFHLAKTPSSVMENGNELKNLSQGSSSQPGFYYDSVKKKLVVYTSSRSDQVVKIRVQL